ncbi:hypothetical protein [Brevundimonas pondensis]|uniref:Uncharacterized protein n=1 Tax=Brevundimonas pondensis TaxID=2774189 RepID=A0ABX7SKH3_9CAUL|nr:hypothetical protein [Brevundimonas pondensis]QTC88177.1 hypothetical protein IFE19_01865 [Brevundimonas pondensis]
MAEAVSAAAKMLAQAAGDVSARPRAVVEPDQIIVNGQALNRAQAEALERAAVLAQGSIEERRQAASMVRRVEGQLASAREAAAVEAGIVDSVIALGGAEADVTLEVVETASFVRDTYGAVMRHQGEPVLKVETATRAKRIDGLESMWKSGALDDQALADGMLYRQTVAKAQASVGSSLNERAGAPRMNSDGAVWSALDRGYAALRLRLVKTAVGEERAMALLDAVAGRGVTIWSLGGGGDVRAGNIKRLAKALQVAGPLLRTTDEQLKRVLRIRAAKSM